MKPYQFEAATDALTHSLDMPPASMRTVVREFNVFRWVGRMLADAGRAKVRQRIEARLRRQHLAR